MTEPLCWISLISPTQNPTPHLTYPPNIPIPKPKIVSFSWERFLRKTWWNPMAEPPVSQQLSLSICTLLWSNLEKTKQLNKRVREKQTDTKASKLASAEEVEETDAEQQNYSLKRRNNLENHIVIERQLQIQRPKLEGRPQVLPPQTPWLFLHPLKEQPSLLARHFIFQFLSLESSSLPSAFPGLVWGGGGFIWGEEDSVS